MVVKANRIHSGLGGHISSYASAATLYEVGFNHFFRGPDGDKLPERLSPESLLEDLDKLSEKQPDAEPEPEPEPKPEVKPESEPEDLISEELEKELKEIEHNPHTEQSVKNTISNLRKAVSDLSSDAKKAKALQDEIESLKGKIAELPISDDLGISQEELTDMTERLTMFRRRFELEEGGTFTKEIDDEIKSNEEQLRDILVKIGMYDRQPSDDDNAISIEKLEGMSGGIVGTFENDPTYFKQIRDIIEKINPLDAEDFAGTIKNVRQLRKKRVNKLKEESGKASEHFDKVRENNAEAVKKQEEHQKNLKDYRVNLGVDLTSKFKFLQDQDVKGTDDQQSKATAHNTRAEYLRSKLDYMINAEGLDDFKEIVESAMMGFALTDRLEIAIKALKDRDATIIKLKGSSRIKEVNKETVPEKKAEFKPTKSIDDALDYVESKRK